MYINLMESIASHKENFSNFKEEWQIHNYSRNKLLQLIQWLIKQQKLIKYRRIEINKYEWMNIHSHLHQTFREYIISSNIYGIFIKIEHFLGHISSLNKFHRTNSI